MITVNTVRRKNGTRKRLSSLHDTLNQKGDNFDQKGREGGLEDLKISYRSATMSGLDLYDLAF